MSSQRARSYKTSSTPTRARVVETSASPIAATSLDTIAAATPASTRDTVRYIADIPATPFRFASHGYLAPGIHDAIFQDAELLLAFNTPRRTQWENLERFVGWAATTKRFACIYLDGGYVSRKANPEDIDCILQSREPYGIAALESMIPFFSYGLDRILSEYGVHLHFWAEGFPGGVQDFRMFFQYVRPRDAAERSLNPHNRKGILRLDLGERSTVPELSSSPVSDLDPASLPSSTARRRR